MPPERGQALGRIRSVRVPAEQAKPSGGAGGGLSAVDRRPNAAAGEDAGVGSGKPAVAEPGRRWLALGRRGQPQASKAQGQEREFLPAALEILETPANPLGRAITLSIIVMFALAIAWAIVGRIDIVAVAPGRVVPVGGTKLVQPREIGSVRAIHVSDGQHVEAGELLVELDATESEVDIGQVVRTRGEAAIEASRLDAFIRAIKGEPLAFGPGIAGLDEATIAMHRSQLESDLAAFEAKLASRQADLSRRAAEGAAIKAEMAKLKEMNPLLVDREATLHHLMTQGHAPKPSWQQAKAQLIDSQHNLEIKKHRMAEAASSLKAAEKELNGMIADTLRETYVKLAEARKTFAQADLALRKALNREEFQKLRAPVAGTVQQLSVHTVGGVVKPAEPLLVIVPDDARLEVRAQVLNKDKGAVFEGQHAEVKFEAFEFTKYGTIAGEVVSVSNDAVENERLGPVYDTRITLAARSIRADGKDLPLTPGMVVTVEIKIGKRRVIDFLLSPLKRYQDEAIRER